MWGLRQRSGRILGEQAHQRRSWGRGQSPSSGLVRGWILLLLFWYSTNRTSWCLPNCRPLHFVRSLSLYIYSSAPFILAVHLSITQVTTWVSIPFNTSLHLLWVAVGSMTLFRGHCLGVTPSLMRSDCQLQAFNAKVTGSCTIALSPCFHSCPSTLVLSFRGWRGWLRWIAYCPFFLGHQQPRTRRSSAICPSSCGPSLVILERFPPWLSPWA